MFRSKHRLVVRLTTLLVSNMLLMVERSLGNDAEARGSAKMKVNIPEFAWWD